MEESEVDDWFSEEKEKLEERFYAVATKDPQKARDDFDKAYKKLILGLQKKQEAIYEHKKRVAAMQAPITRARERVGLFFNRVSLWFSTKHQAVKKWLFDQKVKRILKDKRDL